MITMLKSKLHRAVVTEADVNYVGSITIDKELMDVNGAAARLVSVGDHIIIMAYRLIDEEKAKDHKPSVVFLDSSNNPCEAKECKRIAGN